MKNDMAERSIGDCDGMISGLPRSPASLRVVNHNLLPILRALLRERSVTRAAQTLGMGQPAASAALARLRLVLGDPLLVRSGQGMELSVRGELLLPQVEDLCVRLDVLWKGPDFDPATSNRRFALTTPDYIETVLGPKLIASLDRAGPALSLRFLDVPVEDVLRRMIADIDFIITIRQSVEQTTGDFAVESLYADHIVAVVGRDHPLYLATDIDRADLDHGKFLVFIGGAQFLEKRYDGLRAALGAPSPPSAVSQHYTSMMMIAAQSDCIALIPHRLARIAVKLMPLRVLDVGVSDFAIDVCLAWDRRYDADPAHHWFRGQIRDAVQAVGI